jgi:hypothetical protein
VRIITNPENPAPTRADGASARLRVPTNCGTRAHEQSYAYLLGLYLGDGCVQVSKHGQVLLRISLDAGYSAVIADAWTAMQLSLPHARAHVYRA